MANKRIKDLETLPGVTMDGANDYLVVDDNNGNTSKMAVDDVIKNSGPFTDSATLGPPTMHHGTVDGGSNHKMGESWWMFDSVFNSASACWGHVQVTLGKRALARGVTVRFSKPVGSTAMTVSTPYYFGTMAIQGAGYTPNHNKIINDRGVLKNTGAAIWPGFKNYGHPISANHFMQFGESGFSLWGYGSKNSQHRFTGGLGDLMILSWPG